MRINQAGRVKIVRLKNGTVDSLVPISFLVLYKLFQTSNV